MSDRTIGWVFVAVQAALLIALVLIPGRDDFAVASWMRTASNVVFWLGVVVIKSSWEERRLADRFPAYGDYAATTGRFFPGL